MESGGEFLKDYYFLLIDSVFIVLMTESLSQYNFKDVDILYF